MRPSHRVAPGIGDGVHEGLGGRMIWAVGGRGSKGWPNDDCVVPQRRSRFDGWWRLLPGRSAHGRRRRCARLAPVSGRFHGGALLAGAAWSHLGEPAEGTRTTSAPSASLVGGCRRSTRACGDRASPATSRSGPNPTSRPRRGARPPQTRSLTAGRATADHADDLRGFPSHFSGFGQRVVGSTVLEGGWLGWEASLLPIGQTCS